MKRLHILPIAALFLAGCATHVAPTRTARATATVVAAKAGPDDLYPNPDITPGATNPDVTQGTIHQTICVKNWTATVRPPV
jgi:PBP1b-binding outer membrane lipoprotein LpoB